MRRALALLVVQSLVGCGGGSNAADGTPRDAGMTKPVDAGTSSPVDGGASDTSAEGHAPPPLDGAADAKTPGADATASSVCSVTPTNITCAHQVLMLADATGMREVAYATPLGSPPAAGWPAVVYFQGSFVPGHGAFAATSSDAFGMYWLTATIARLLDDGYAVVAPDAQSAGSTFWQTNIPPYAQAWSGCSDDVLMQNLFAALGTAKFGAIDTSHLYAMGISSGGFMTSRMAVSYAGRFRALADHSGSYATCSATCTVPTPLPSDHPPTLFLHGDADTIVPMTSVQPYLDALQAEGHETKLVTDADAGHQWLPAGPDAISAWFKAHP